MMKKLASMTALATVLLAGSAMAQTAPSATSTEPAATTSAPAMASSSVRYLDMQSEGQWLASSFMGETVRGTDDKSIGEINNLLVDKDGKVVAAVIGVGGFLGIGEKDVAVPFEALQLSNERDEKITLAATEEQLRNAPEFKDLDDQDSARSDAAAQTGSPATSPAATSPARPATPVQ
jgi:hypothetical protein